MASLVPALRRAASMSPLALARWVGRKIRFRLDSRNLPAFADTLSEARLLSRIQAGSVDEALLDLTNANPFLRPETVPQDQQAGIRARANQARSRIVDLLGSGPVQLSTPINWAVDFKTDISWPMVPMAHIAINRLDEPCDIKVVWDLSRLQWLIPVAQAWRINSDDDCAHFVRAIIEEWIDGNPIARGPNWVCTMDVALRAVSLSWLATQCLDAPSWSDPGFRSRLLKTLWLHGYFINRHLEWTDVNGNHLMADALGLVVLGAALPGPDANRWSETGWSIMRGELTHQINPDGGTFEVSTAYHRFVFEMVLVAALVRSRCNLTIDSDAIDHLTRMVDFMAAYLRRDGSAPHWGDEDDGRVLPFGATPVQEHAALAQALKMGLDLRDAIIPDCPADPETVFWLTGQGVDTDSTTKTLPPSSQAFPETGAYILRFNHHHVFVDAGPVGMAGRGGHGHNDCLNADIVLNGVPVFIDPGTYTYTANANARNKFRSSAAHNSPIVDSQEINRMDAADRLWMLRNDAQPIIHAFQVTPDGGHLIASHTGYDRLSDPVRPKRLIQLLGNDNVVCIADLITGNRPHMVTTCFTVAPSAKIEITDEQTLSLVINGQSFRVSWLGSNWSASIEAVDVSSSYGVKHPSHAIVFQNDASHRAYLSLVVGPDASFKGDPSPYHEGNATLLGIEASLL